MNSAVLWRMLLVGTLMSLLVGAWLSARVDSERASTAAVGSHANRQAALSSLPAAALGPVSATLGAAEPSYRLSASRAGFQASNPSQKLTVRFARSGVQLASRGVGLGLGLQAVGYGSSLRAVGGARLSANANRADYKRAGIEEHYANGPLGLEQGFELARAPSVSASGALTLAMRFSGDVRASLDEAGRSILFAGARGSLLRYGDLLATDARGRVLRSWLVLDGRTILLRVDTAGARYPIRIDPLIENAMLTGGSGSEAALFGYSVALSADGNTALIGHKYASRAAWVFTRSGSTWEPVGEPLTVNEEGVAGGEPCAEEPGECGGRSVALSADGTTALVGGPAADANSGAVWVFTRSGSEWTQSAELTGGGEESAEGRFGQTLALSGNGDTALIGGPKGLNQRGAAWVFTRSGSKWEQQGPILTGGAEESREGRFGSSVALSADASTALIGARTDGVGTEDGLTGSAWVFTRSGSTWQQQGQKLTGGAAEDGEGQFGSSVALSAFGNTALIGARRDDGGIGAAWVFTRSGTSWPAGTELTGAGELGDGEFGYSVALSADAEVALIGARLDAGDVGAAWLFTRSGTSWEQQGAKRASPDASAPGRFGASVALSADGETALIGAPAARTKPGAVWAFANTTVPVPTVASVDPESGSSAGGTPVTIRGAGFTAGASVEIGGVAASSVEVLSETELTAVTPPHALGAAAVVVADANRSSTGGPTYTYVPSSPPPPLPTVTSIDPESGSSAGGTPVTITGSGFIAGATTVEIGGVAASSVEVLSETELTAVTPANAPGAAEVAVADANGASTGGPAYTYVTTSPPSQAPAPTVTSISPKSGPSEGGTPVTIIGSGFTPSATVEIGGVAASFVEVLSETELTAITPPHLEGAVEVVVADANGVSTGGPKFTFATPPTVVLTAIPDAGGGVLSSMGSLLPAPQLGATGNLAPVSGTVLVKLPGSDTFVLLTGLRQVPFGTVVNATNGKVAVTTAGPHGSLQTMTFYEGQFKLTQVHGGRVFATLRAGDFAVCPRARKRARMASAASSHAPPKHVVRKLWASGHGSYSTKGNYAAGAVLGTVWLTEDLCDGTLIHVVTDSVEVTNLVTHHRFRVTAGHSYLAKAP